MAGSSLDSVSEAGSSPPRNPFKYDFEDQEASAEETPQSPQPPEVSLDKDLEVICADSPTARRVLKSLRISSLIIFGNFWDTDGEMSEELLGLGMPQSLIGSIAKMARAACNRSASAEAASFVGRSHQAKHAIPSPPPIPIEAIHVAVAGASAVESNKSRKKLETALEGIWEILIAAGARSKLLMEAKSLSTDLQLQMRAYLFREWADMPHSSLQNYVNGWKAWSGWCKAESGSCKST